MTRVRPWPALGALVIGFFMILLDTTIVSVANPAIMRGLNLGSDYAAVIWVTSAYLLAAAVPLLVTGRLGDRFGPKNIYLIGLAVFTAASAACGLSGTVGGGIGMLIGARAAQGLGAALMTPQTMAVITRIFPADKRGPAMGLWGAVGGVAGLVGPVLGGVLVDALGWEWIFYINLPIGIIGLLAAWRWVPALPTHRHRFDVPGIALSTAGMFLLIFGIEEGDTYHWGTISGPVTIWWLVGAGLGLLAGFCWWQARNPHEPLLPLRLFGNRNFSLAAAAICAVGFTVTAMQLPLIFFLQLARGLSPTQSALMLAPTAIVSGVLSPLMGRRLTLYNARAIATGALMLEVLGLTGYAITMATGVDAAWLLIPATVVGLANAGMWGPLATIATRDLHGGDVGAGSGVYSTTQQIGSVLGSACMAALIQWRLAAELPGTATASVAQGASQLPPDLQAAFAAAMAQTLIAPASIALCGAGLAALLVVPRRVA